MQNKKIKKNIIIPKHNKLELSNGVQIVAADSSELYTEPNQIVIKYLSNFLTKSSYSKAETKNNEILLDPVEGNNPSLKIKQEPKRKTLIIEIVANAWHPIVEFLFRYLKELGVNYRSLEVFSIPEEDKLFEIDSSTTLNMLFTVQQRLFDRNMSNSDVVMVLNLNAYAVSKRLTTKSPSPLIKPKLPIKTTLGVSPVMFKRSKLSQLAKRDIPEPEPVIVAPPEPEVQPEDVVDLPILQELSENEQTILREILKRPKKKVQSNHIAKKTNFEQDIIRDVLRDLVNKGILRVSSGWYVLKKQPSGKDDEEEEDDEVTSSKKPIRSSKRVSSKRRGSRKAGRKKSEVTKQVEEEEDIPNAKVEPDTDDDFGDEGDDTDDSYDSYYDEF